VRPRHSTRLDTTAEPALAKAVAVAFEAGPVSVITTWQTWVLIGASIGGFLLLQNALQAGRLVASQPGIRPAGPPGRRDGGRAVFTAEGCVAGSVDELNDGAYRAGREGAGQRSSLWGQVCPVLGFRLGGGCVSC
jgi:hypothetical protein